MFLPDVAAMLAVAALAYCLFVFGAGDQLFRDSDTGWHIRAGEWILAHHALPQTDLYSFSKAGEPWILWEWGSDVAIALAHRLDGLRGVLALFALAIAASVWMCCRLHFAAGGDFFVTALMAPLIVTTTSLHWLARPHLLSWLFLLGALWYAERLPARLGPQQLAGIGLLTALWANLHGSFFMAPLIALTYAAGHLIRPFLWQLGTRRELARARAYLWAALAALGGSLLNPYGWNLHAHIVAYLRNEELTSRIAEFQSFNFHDKDAWQVLAVVLLALAGGVLALTQKKVAHFLLAAGLVWASLRSARMLPLLALLILPLANGAITEALRGARHLRPGLARALEAALEYSARLRWFDRRVHGAAFCLVAGLLLLVATHAPAYSKGIGFPHGRFPAAAAAALDKLTPAARILAPDSFGGYLIYRFNGRLPVYFDGRSDFYGAAFMKEYLVLIEARPGWQATVRRYGFTHALLPRDSALKSALEQAGWAPLYHDDVATLLEAR